MIWDYNRFWRVSNAKPDSSVGLEEIEKLDINKIFLPNGFYVEKIENKVGIIMNKFSTKWNGINFIRENYGIIEENVLSFGDDDADIEMIKNSGIGIAVENGNEKIKNIANYICKNNEEDGVAKWIEENILTKGQTST